jgi:AraC-like DNA-binding protein
MSAPRTGKREPRSSPLDSPPPGVIASAATGIVNFIETQGGDVDQIFGRARIGPDMAGCPTLKLDLHSYCQLFEVAARQTRCDNFGLWFGHQFKPRDLGLWGYSAVSAPTLGSALDNLVRLFRWHQESSLMSLRRGKNGLMYLEYQIEAPAIVERRQDAELSLGMFFNVFRECLGQQWVAEEVHFEHPHPADSKDHERAFGAPVYFSLPRNALVFRPDILTTPMPHGDSRLMAMMEMCLEQLAGGTSKCVGIVDRVKTAIRTKLPGGYPPLGDLAETMRITPAAVQRELARDGLIYKDLVEKTRRELALAYLKQPHLPFSEIALLLGYSELSAFSRAVRRWTGRSPRSWRTQFEQENVGRTSG